MKKLRWWHGWPPLILLPPLLLMFYPATWPSWGRMWLLAFLLYGGCKWLTWRRTIVPGTPIWRHLAYLFAWPGLDPAAFFRADVRPSQPRVREWLFALGKLAAGLGLIFGIARLVPGEYPYLVGWTGMVGIVFTLHFGLFHLLSCWWRSWGLDAKPLMNWPILSESVSEFWGRRWNLAFRDLTHRFLFRPLTPRLGARGAMLAGFVFSGAIHDLVISVPVGGGYGGPSVFFLVQAAAIAVERGPLGRRLGLGAGWRGWAFTMAVLLGPVCLLFHRPFVDEAVLPFVRFLGAIP